MALVISARARARRFSSVECEEHRLRLMNSPDGDMTSWRSRPPLHSSFEWIVHATATSKLMHQPNLDHLGPENNVLVLTVLVPERARHIKLSANLLGEIARLQLDVGTGNMQGTSCKVFTRSGLRKFFRRYFSYARKILYTGADFFRRGGYGIFSLVL